MSNQNFTWTNFYMALADRLLDYRENRNRLIHEITEAYASSGIKFPKLDSGNEIADIDPFTVFGLFNKGITPENRLKIITSLAKALSVDAELPTNFEGIPTLNNLNATFYRFSSDPRRGEEDIENLWDLFTAGLELTESETASTREKFVQAYERTINLSGLKWKTFIGLYWARPFRFVSLDSRNRWFIGDMAAIGEEIAGLSPKERGPLITDGNEYLAICDEISKRLGTPECPFASFPELANAAYLESERVNKERKAEEKASQSEAEQNALGDADVETVRYWVYSPGTQAEKWDEFYETRIMAISWKELGDLRAYPSKEDMRLKLVELDGGDSSQKNNAHAVWQFVNEIKPGDVVFVKQGRRKIVGKGVVKGDYEYDDSMLEFPNRRSVEWTHKCDLETDDDFAMKTLTEVTDYTDLIAKLNSYFSEEAEEAIEPQPATDYPAYTEEDFLAEVFMSEQEYEELTGVLRKKKNIILQGAPGVGKTFIAKRLAYSIMGVKDIARVKMVQFHQSYSYEDFVEGFRPSENGFELTRGAFYRFCKVAEADSENDYFFIIDEINRGNLSKIFGELFMLIENDKRGPKNKLELLYSRELFSVPSNLYIIGMMNTADRSLAMLDYALRRRFAFFEMKPGFQTEGFASYLDTLACPKLNNLVGCVVQLNEAISSDDALGEGFRIGHSYFCGFSEAPSDQKLSSLVEYELIPMLKEYWFDDKSKTSEWAGKLRNAIK